MEQSGDMNLELETLQATQENESSLTKAEFERLKQELSSVEESLAVIQEKNKRLNLTIGERQKVVDRQKAQI